MGSVGGEEGVGVVGDSEIGGANEGNVPGEGRKDGVTDGDGNINVVEGIG